MSAASNFFRSRVLVTLCTIAAVLFVAALFVPVLDVNKRQRANAASAVERLSRLSVLQNAYAASHPAKGFTCQLSNLNCLRLLGTRMIRMRSCSPGFRLDTNLPLRSVKQIQTERSRSTKQLRSPSSAVVRDSRLSVQTKAGRSGTTQAVPANAVSLCGTHCSDGVYDGGQTA